LFLLQAVLGFFIVASIGVVSLRDFQGSSEQNRPGRLLAVAGEVANISADNVHNATEMLSNLA